MSDTPWLDLAEAEIGTKEVPGEGDNPAVLDMYADAGHPEIAHDSVPWCAAFVGAMLKRTGYPTSGSLAARSYLQYGVKLDAPVLGCIVVLTRGANSWEGHVGFWLAETPTLIKVLGGNQGDAVSIAAFSKASMRVLGYRMPVAPTVKALRAAGSTEIAAADVVQKVAIAGSGAAGVAKAADAVMSTAPPPVIPPLDPSLKNATDYMTTFSKLQEGFNAVGKLIGQHWWVLLIAVGIAAWLFARWWKQQRLARHASGLPLSAQLQG